MKIFSMTSVSFCPFTSDCFHLPLTLLRCVKCDDGRVQIVDCDETEFTLVRQGWLSVYLVNLFLYSSEQPMLDFIECKNI